MRRKMVLIITVFIIGITALRLSVVSLQQPVIHPKVERGVLDLRGWTLPKDRTIVLDGEWEFYPNRIVSSVEEASREQVHQGNNSYIAVPGAWDAYFDKARSEITSFRYGTYRLRILLDEHEENSYSIRTNGIKNASAVYVNGKLAGGTGLPAEAPDSYEARRIPYTVTLPRDSSSLDIWIPVSNHAGEGGIVKSIRFGTQEAVEHRTLLSVTLQLLLSVVLFVHASYALMLYFLGAGNRGLNYFALTIFCALISVIAADDRLLFLWFPQSFEVTVKITLLSYIGVMAFLPPLFKNMFPEHGNIPAVRWFSIFCAAYAGFVALFPSKLTLPTMSSLLVAVLVLSVVVSSSILRAAVRKQEDVIYLLICCTSLGMNIFWTLFSPRIFSYELMHYPFDLIFTVLAFAAFWFKRFFRSVARTKELAEELKQANEVKDEFLANTSHELRNPLHGIINIAQNLLDDPNHPVHEAQKTRLELQVSVARRMSLMVDDLLDIVRLKDRALQLRLGNVRVQSVVSGTVEMIRFLLEGKPITLIVDIPDRFPSVKADEHRLTQIMFNLLHNAVKFTDEGRITIRADLVNGMARIQISDTGIGMDEDTQQRVFLPYEQGNTNTSSYGGFGLGLSICKQLVELQSGELHVTSILGEGSTFMFTIPLSGEDEQTNRLEYIPQFLMDESAAAAEASPEHGGMTETLIRNWPKIMVIDDDPVNLQIMSDMLGGQHYEVSTALSGAEALANLEQADFDLLIMDAMMPHMSGYELARIIRERYSASELPILLLTARSRPEDIQAGFQSGANDYVTKPVSSLELKSRVRAWTELKISIEERLRIEAAWLQAQIQPHFLYNTINTISALGTIDISRMQALLEHFSNYLRTSFDFHNTDSVVSVKRELELVQSYLYIEKERFGERLEVQWMLEDELYFQVPPLSIQTLVENAVRHGLLTRSSGGIVSIQIARHDNDINISVRDNGVGMDTDQMRKALDSPTSDQGGIGLRNTNRRLKQLYGRGLEIESKLNQGTTVTFRIPK
ncbi:ATP-binding protein [Paenibacillus sp. GD4]|uniref:hybrid sensor histidine kinase/response regulator n=1 Tax=Paenibacillus sp. GD4 TaxID=3068890 RepID=UPI0027967891|nr:ATP-binding protein [Paenibacillus sp. GD4]MDQ1913691.1 ATP-binding protein [Paenibacillus sp. GD4]